MPTAATFRKRRKRPLNSVLWRVFHHCFLAGLSATVLFALPACRDKFGDRSQIPCYVGHGAWGSPEHSECLAQAIPSFGGYHQDGCKMVVYIKDLSNEPIARRVMEPLAAEQLHRFPCIFCKELEVREAEFDVAELTRWSKLANRLMLEDVVIAGGAQTHGNAFWGNRFYINVQNLGDKLTVEQLLRAHGVPNGAYCAYFDDSDFCPWWD